MTISAIIGILAAGVAIYSGTRLFILCYKSEDNEPMGDEAGQVYPVSVDNEVKKG